jgi:hypothetical protein
MLIARRNFQFSLKGSRRAPSLSSACFCLLFTGGAQQNFAVWRYLLSTTATGARISRHENPLATLLHACEPSPRSVLRPPPVSAPFFAGLPRIAALASARRRHARVGHPPNPAPTRGHPWISETLRAMSP